jgi:TIR domain
VLLDALDRNDPIEWIELSSICKTMSLNLNRSFDSTIRFLQLISLVHLDEDRRVLRHRTINYKEIKADYTFCTWLTKKLIEEITRNGLLSTVLNTEMIKFDINHEAYSLNMNLIPFRYPMIKLYLLNMGIARPDNNLRSHIIINNIYKQLFKVMIDPILTPSTKLDLHSGNAPFSHLSATKGVKVFISYAHKDEAIKVELTKHFSELRRKKIIVDWNDRMILPGEEWDATIKMALEEADIIFFLFSADFIASDYINNVEIGVAIERHDRKLTRLIPIIVRPCDFASSPLCYIQALPKDAKPITIWEDRDQAFLNIVTEFKKIIGHADRT